MAEELKIKKNTLKLIGFVLVAFAIGIFLGKGLGCPATAAVVNTSAGSKDVISVVGETVGGFTELSEKVCSTDGKPNIYFFGVSWCPHCNWAKPAVKSIESKFKGYISPHFWYEMDKDTPTQEDQLVYQKYNPRGSIPTFVFGCKYVRIGTKNEPEDDIQKEEDELTAIVCSLTDNQPKDVCNQVSDLVSQIE